MVKNRLKQANNRQKHHKYKYTMNTKEKDEKSKCREKMMRALSLLCQVKEDNDYILCEVMDIIDNDVSELSRELNEALGKVEALLCELLDSTTTGVALTNRRFSTTERDFGN